MTQQLINTPELMNTNLQCKFSNDSFPNQEGLVLIEDKDNNVSLEITNSGSESIVLSSGKAQLAPIVFQIYNVFTTDEWYSYAVEMNSEGWTIKTLQINKTFFLAISPGLGSCYTLSAGETLKLSLLFPSPLSSTNRNGIISSKIQGDIDTNPIALSFNQVISLDRNPKKKLSDDLLVEFVSENYDTPKEETELANLVTRTPISLGDPIKNKLYLQFKNLKDGDLLTDDASNEARFFIWFDKSFATTEQIKAIDMAIHKGVQTTDFEVKPNFNLNKPFWELIPLQKNILGKGQTMELDIEHIVTNASVGNTNLYVSYKNVPGYVDDTLPMSIQIDETEAYIGSFFVNTDTKSVAVVNEEVTFTFEVHGLTSTDWEIIFYNETSGENLSYTYNVSTRSDETLKRTFNHEFDKPGDYTITLKSIPKTKVEKAVSKIVYLKVNEIKPEIIRFLFHQMFHDPEYLQELTIQDGAQAFYVHYHVHSEVKTQWQIVEIESGKVVASFYSYNGSDTKGYFSAIQLQNGRYGYRLESIDAQENVSQDIYVNVEETGTIRIDYFTFENGESSCANGTCVYHHQFTDVGDVGYWNCDQLELNVRFSVYTSAEVDWIIVVSGSEDDAPGTPGDFSSLHSKSGIATAHKVTYGSIHLAPNVTHREDFYYLSDPLQVTT